MPELPRGVDVASYQGYPDWQAVAAAGYSFAFTKVTEDDGYVNQTFTHNWKGIKAAGMSRGAYHFARPEVVDAAEEADWFLSQIDAHGGIDTGDILALDLESGAGNLGPWTLAFLNQVEDRVGFRPIVYTGTWFTSQHSIAAYPELGAYGLWLAAYQNTMPAPPPPWDTVAFWQHSSSGRVPGIVGDVDLNVFNGPADRISLYGKPGASVPAPAPAPVPPSDQSAQIAALQAQVAALTQQRDGLINSLAYTLDNLIEDQNAAQTKEAKRVRIEALGGPRP